MEETNVINGCLLCTEWPAGWTVAAKTGRGLETEMVVGNGNAVAELTTHAEKVIAFACHQHRKEIEEDYFQRYGGFETQRVHGPGTRLVPEYSVGETLTFDRDEAIATLNALPKGTAHIRSRLVTDWNEWVGLEP